MTTKLEQAARQALLFCEEISSFLGKYPYVNGTEIVADARQVSASLREALDHSADTGKMILTTEQAQQIEEAMNECLFDAKWYAAKEAIRAVRAQEQAEQEPVAWMGAYDNTDLYYRKPPQADVVPLYAAPVKQAEQEPVGKGCRYNGGTCTRKGCVSGCQAEQLCVENNDLKFKVEELEAITTEPVKQEPVAYLRMGSDQRFVVTKAAEELLADKFHELYTAPVRTKDLTDAELDVFFNMYWWQGKDGAGVDLIEVFRAVIAADREKNK